MKNIPIFRQIFISNISDELISSKIFLTNLICRNLSGTVRNLKEFQTDIFPTIKI